MKKSEDGIQKHNNSHCHHGHHHEHCETHDTCISIVPIFNHLEKEQMDEIMTVRRSSTYRKGEHIYGAGDKADSLYIVNKGKIKIYRLSESGKEQLLRILQPGDFTGEMALFSETVHETYAEAIEETSICTINRAEFQELLLKYPSIALKVLSEFSNRLDQSEKQATRFATEKVETRIALFLAESVDKDTDPMEVVLPMNKKDLASYLGTTPETFSRKLADLEDEGYIKQISNRKIKIIDLDGLLNI